MFMYNESHVFLATSEDAGGYWFSATGDMVIGLLLVVSIVTGTLGNIPAFIYFYRRRHEFFPDYLYTIISLVDLFICLFSVPICCSLFNHRHAVLFSSYSFCALYALSLVILHWFSMYMVMVISVSRTVAIRYPFFQVKIGAVKLSCLAYALFLLLFVMSLYFKEKIMIVYYSAVVHCNPIFWIDEESEVVLWTFHIIVKLTKMVLVPITVFISLVISSVELLRKPTLCNEDDAQFRRISVTIALFTCVFLVCNIPVFLLTIQGSWRYWFNTGPLPNWGVFWYDWLVGHVFLLITNAAVNPCLYLCRMSHFRDWVSGVVVGLLRGQTNRHNCALLFRVSGKV